MKYSKEEIESKLKELLNELLESGKQDGSIIDLTYDESEEQCYVTLSVHIVEEDDYVGFQGY